VLSDWVTPWLSLCERLSVWLQVSECDWLSVCERLSV
jgi:hypothetical protein